MGTFMCVNWKKNYKKNERKLQEQRPRYQIIFRPLNGDRVPSHCASCHRNALILWTVECAVRRVHFFDTVFGCVFTSFPRGLFFSQSTFSTHTHTKSLSSPSHHNAVCMYLGALMFALMMAQGIASPPAKPLISFSCTACFYQIKMLNNHTTKQ